MITNSQDFYINIKDKPKWDSKKQYFEQSLEAIDFYQNEFDKIVNGVTIDGVFIHPWLYFHTNFFKTPIPVGKEEPIMCPPMRDNEWYMAEMYQKAEEAKKNLFLFGSRRWSKALENSEPLYYTDGTQRPIGDAKIGDSIIGGDGKPTNIIGVYPQGKVDLYKVTLSDGRSVVCCDEHLWQVQNNKTDEIVIAPLKDFKLNYDEYSIPINPNLLETITYIPISNIEQVRSDYATCIRVDNKDKLFLTRDCIVTHNSVMETSFLYWKSIIKSNSSAEIICGSADDLRTISNLLSTAHSNMHPAFLLHTTRKDFTKHVQFGYKERGTNLDITHSNIYIKNADAGKEKASEKGAGGAPSFVIIDEALEESTILFTKDSTVPIKDINIGDEIYDSDGNLTKVVDKLRFENRQLYKITFADGREIECCENHLWEVFKNGKTDKPLILTTKELLQNKLLYNKYDHRYNSNKPYYINSIRQQSAIKYSEKQRPLEPYFIGLYLGDGLKKSGAICTIDKEVKEYLKDYSCRLNMVYSEKEVKSCEHPDYRVCRIKNKKGKNSYIIDSLKELNIFENKGVPNLYLYSSIEDRIELLKGLCDTDGYITKNGSVSFSSSNENIVDGVKKLLGSLGIRYSCTKIKKFFRDKEGNKVYKDSNNFNILSNISLFKVERKKKREKVNTTNKKSINRRNYLSIVNITPSKIGTAYCIKVDNSSKLFLAGDYIVTHNCGKFSFLDLYLGLLPALITPHGQKGTIMLSGTSGNEKLSRDAFKVLSNPEAYKILPMDWDILERKIPKNQVTWTRTKFGMFIPPQMAYEDGVTKDKSNLAEYLDVKGSKALKNIEINITNWERSKKVYDKNREDLARDKDALNKEIMYHPFDPQECFLSGTNNPFPQNEARLHRLKIIEDGDIGKDVDIFKKEDGTLGYELSNKKRIKFPFDGGIHESPVIFFSDPPKEIPEKFIFVSGLDPYKAKEATTDSAGSYYCIKRKIDIVQPIEEIVCTYTARPTTQKVFNRTCEYLIDGWNSECLMENADQSFIQYLEEKNKLYILAEGVEWSKMVNPKTQAKTTIGYSPTVKNQNYCFGLAVNYCWEEVVTGINDKGENITRLGITYIKDPDLLQEIIDYKPGMNCDRITAFGAALAWAKYLDMLRVMPKNMSKKQTEDEERARKKRIKELKTTAYSKLHNRNNFLKKKY